MEAGSYGNPKLSVRGSWRTVVKGWAIFPLPSKGWLRGHEKPRRVAELQHWYRSFPRSQRLIMPMPCRKVCCLKRFASFAMFRPSGSSTITASRHEHWFTTYGRFHLKVMFVMILLRSTVAAVASEYDDTTSSHVMLFFFKLSQAEGWMKDVMALLFFDAGSSKVFQQAKFVSRRVDSSANDQKARLLEAPKNQHVSSCTYPSQK